MLECRIHQPTLQQQQHKELSYANQEGPCSSLLMLSSKLDAHHSPPEPSLRNIVNGVVGSRISKCSRIRRGRSRDHAQYDRKACIYIHVQKKG